MINELVARHSKRPALLAGDLNDAPESKSLERFASSWFRANAKPLATTPVDQPTRQIDYILLRPQESWKVIDVKVIDEAIASDHRAILAVLELVPSVDTKSELK